MDWFGIVALSVLFGLTNWFKDRKLISFFKDFITALLIFVFLKLLFSYIELPDIPDKLQPIIFAGPIILATIVLSFKGFRQNKK